jgi:hypothetical protein
MQSKEKAMRDTIDMAREAWISEAEAEMLRDFEECYLSCTYLDDLKAFEALVRADEREAAQAEHEADKVIIEYHEAAIKRLEAAILAEREACAKVCDELPWKDMGHIPSNLAFAAAIRSRSSEH